MSDFNSLDINQTGKTQETQKDWMLPSKKEETKKSNTDLTFEDMLMLMVTQMQNQTIDNQMDTNDMMNQLIQMTVMQAMTEMTSQVEELTTANIMSYSASLVGKEVTVGVLDAKGNLAEEIVGTVTATGTYNGQQVIFLGDRYYPLSSIMSVGRLPDDAVDGNNPTKPTEPDEGEGDKTEGTGKPEGGGTEGSDKTEGTDETGNAGGEQTKPEESGQTQSDSGISPQSYSVSNVEARNAASAAQNRAVTPQRTVTPQAVPAAAVQSSEPAAQAQEEDEGVPSWLLENGVPETQTEESGVPSWLLSQSEQAVAAGVPSWLVGSDA